LIMNNINVQEFSKLSKMHLSCFSNIWYQVYQSPCGRELNKVIFKDNDHGTIVQDEPQCVG
jgi:hypothetical protein